MIAPKCPQCRRAGCICELLHMKPPRAPKPVPTACYCSERMSGGVPCQPGRCPNVPKPSPSAEPLPEFEGWWWDGRAFCRNDPQYHEMSLDQLSAIAELAGLAIVPAAEIVALRIKVENLKFRLKMAEDSNPDNVLSKHNAMLMAIEQRDLCKHTAEKALADMQADWDACHRQHEQCMKLLEICEQQRLPPDVGELVREMLSKGELPEGSL